MAALVLDKKDFIQVHTAPAVLTPFEEDLSHDADLPLPSIEHDPPHHHNHHRHGFVFGPPSYSSEGRYTAARSSPRRLSDHTQLTEPSSISDMPSDTFSLAHHRTKAFPSSSSATAFSSPAISPTKEGHPAAYINTPHADTYFTHHHHHHQPHDAARSTLKSKRPHPHRRHHTSTSTPTRSPHHHLQTPCSSSSHQQPPLILLHITLLPPPSPPFPLHLLPARLQAQYRLLSDKLADAALLQRGLLIPHPRDEYDVLEERVLEALGLVAPRVLKCGHFGGAGGAAAAAASHARRDSGVEAVVSAEGQDAVGEQQQQEEKEVEREEEEEEGEQHVCDTCRTPVADDGDPARAAPPHADWSIKVYAANGLMRAGAWSAAWSEMERVDVEVAPWVGKAVLRRVQQRLDEEEREREAEEERAEEERRREVREAEERIRARVEKEAEGRLARAAREAEEEKLRLIGSAALSAAAERKMAEENMKDAVRDAVREERKRVRDEAARKRAEMEAAKRDIPLGVLLKKSLSIAATDPRNILILVLSALVVFLPMQAAAPGLPSSGLDVAYFDTPMVDNFTVAPVYPPREVVHSTTTTATTTATYTAFILETIAALPTATAAPEKDQPTLEPEFPAEHSHFDETQQLKDTIFASSIQILDSAFEKMSAIVSSAAQAEQEASGNPLITMPAPGSPDDEEAVVDRERSAGEDSGRFPVGEAIDLTAELPNVETMVPSGGNPDTRSAPALAGQHSLSTTDEVTEAMDTNTEAVEEQITEPVAASSSSPMADIPITLAADNEHVSIDRTHPAQIFTSTDSLCPAGDEDHEVAPMVDVGSDVAEQSMPYQPATDYFNLAPTCPAEAHGETPMEVEDDADEDAAEAFMEAVVLEGSTEEIVVEQAEGAELAELVVQLPNEVESPAEEAFQRDGNVEEEIAVVLDV